MKSYSSSGRGDGEEGREGKVMDPREGERKIMKSHTIMGNHVGLSVEEVWEKRRKETVLWMFEC